jgi:hypothetical protein
MGKPQANDFWQEPLPVCHLRLEILQPAHSRESLLRKTCSVLFEGIYGEIPTHSYVA